MVKGAGVVVTWYGRGGRSCGNMTTTFFFTLSGGGVVEGAGVVVTGPQTASFLKVHSFLADK